MLSNQSYAKDNEKKEKSDVNTTVEVEYKDYVEKSALKDVKCIFLRNDPLFIEEEKGVLVEYLVKDRDKVKKGDPVISYEIPYDSIALEEMKYNLENMENTYETAVEQKKVGIHELVKKYKSLKKNVLEAKITQLNIEKLEIELEQYQFQTKKSLEELKNNIKKIESNRKLQYIYATYDGIVVNSDKIKKGDEIGKGMELARIFDTESAVLGASVTDASHFRYNMEVSVTAISNMKEDKDNRYKGKVIEEPSLLYNKESTDMIYIQLEKEDIMETIESANITAESVIVKNVPVIPLSAVKTNNELSYVYILEEGGNVRKQYITGRNNGTDMWVYNGLKKGQKIVIE
jgi:HlyD family secretion protein